MKYSKILLLSTMVLGMPFTGFAQKIVSYTKLTTFTFTEGEQKMDPPSWESHKLQYDAKGRLIEIKSFTSGGTTGSENVAQFDYSEPNIISTTTTFISDDGEKTVYKGKYYMDADGYCTKFVDITADYECTMKYEDGHIVELKRNDNEMPDHYVWKNGNLVENRMSEGGEFEDIETRTYTNIPMTLNFNLGEYFVPFGYAEYLHLLSKGFKNKNYVEKVENHHPIEDEYTYKFNKNRKEIKVECQRLVDSYSAHSTITIKTE